MMASTATPGDIIERWKIAQWPPKNMHQIAGLPIYLGEPELVADYALSLGEVMMSVSSHIHDECRGRKPRWMTVPKVVMGVDRLNLVKATAKASKRFDCVTELLVKCGNVSQAESGALEKWLREHPGLQLVAHKECVDLRAYVFVDKEERPLRLRFYESGLVLGAKEGKKIVIQDHRKTVRTKRSDAYATPLAKTSKGWSIYPCRSVHLETEE